MMTLCCRPLELYVPDETSGPRLKILYLSRDRKKKSFLCLVNAQILRSVVLQVSNVAFGHVGSFWKSDLVSHHYEHRVANDEVPPGIHQSYILKMMIMVKMITLILTITMISIIQMITTIMMITMIETIKTIAAIGSTFPLWQIPTTEGIHLR